MTKGDPYVYPGTQTLINKYGVHNPELLEQIERRHTLDRMSYGVPHGRFDLDHLRKVHHHLFQDVYDWAGETRTVPLAKGGTAFLPPGRIEMGFADIHRRLEACDFLHGLNSVDFSEQAADIISDVNHAHPFREGNGRTQLLYLEQLAEQAGHPLALDQLTHDVWIGASIQSHDQEPRKMRNAIASILVEPDTSIDRQHQPLEPETDKEPDP